MKKLAIPEPPPNVNGVLWFDKVTPNKPRWQASVCAGSLWYNGEGKTPHEALTKALEKVKP